MSELAKVVVPDGFIYNDAIRYFPESMSSTLEEIRIGRWNLFSSISLATRVQTEIIITTNMLCSDKAI